MQDTSGLKPYRTVDKPGEIEYVISRSRFLGRCFPVRDEQEALRILEEIKKRHWDARHNCFAYRLLNGAARYSDDGEPQGTAGLPIMEVIKKRELYDVLIVSTRYFGGILLGAGGLVRAYTRSAADAVDAAGLVSMEPCTVFSVRSDYPHWNAAQTVMERFGAIAHTEFSDAVDCAFRCRTTDAEPFLLALMERTEARVTAEAVGEEYGGFPV